MSLDILTLREDTPGSDSVLHFNNAGTGLMPRPVLSAITDHLHLEATIGGYEAHYQSNHLYNDTYTAIETLIGAQPGEIALAENATRAWDQVFYGMKLKPGDRIIADQASYASSYLAMLQRVKNDGIVIDAIPNDEHGQVDVEALEKRISSRTRMICATHVPTNSGLVNPAGDIGQVARKHGIPYVLDACQSVGQVPVDVETIGCDFLSATGRKYLRGPRGTGFLYVRTASLDLVEPPFLDLHAAVWTKMNEYEMRPDASRFENWEGYVAGKIGLGRAVRYVLDLGPEQTFARIAMLASSLRDRLRAIPGVRVHDIGLVKGGIVTFSHQHKDSQTIKQALDREKMNVQLSFPEWSRLDAETRGLPVMIRASVHYYNTDEEIDRFCNGIEKICKS
ncbi:MAG: aminotransferase class V-fold PLP-dependent enzyme [Bacteroidetes bacterium]|nr:aminotransferase class V-fold PLP-dependent enzyme [Bacteroidota bacterium]